MGNCVPYEIVNVRPCCWLNIALLITFAGYEVFTAVVMKSIIFWDMTPCSPLSFNRRFGGTYHLHLLGRRIATCLLAGLLN
jgi:hypothetical protein